MTDLIRQSSQLPSYQTATPWLRLSAAPAQVIRGANILAEAGAEIAALGRRPLVVLGDHTRAVVEALLRSVVETLSLEPSLELQFASGVHSCSEAELLVLHQQIAAHDADLVIGVGGGKALDAAKLLAYQSGLPVITVPTSAATCAAWTALANVYSDQGGFLYDVALPTCPNLLILDYALLQTAPQRLLVAGIGDALAKWYEASVSSGHSERALIIAAVQQARVLRDLLLQKAQAALQSPGSAVWQDVVDANVLLAGVIGGLGGAQCRTVAAHAVHNGLTHLQPSHSSLHGEKVAYGILVQLRLEELVQGNWLAATARQQLLKFYSEIGLPQSLADLGFMNVTLAELQQAAELACRPGSDIHHLPFEVTPPQLLAAMVSTTAPIPDCKQPAREAESSVLPSC
jgi:glycerol dehydrogenase